MSLKFMNRKALPIFLGVILIIPTFAGSYIIATTTAKWDWALHMAATRADNLPLVIHASFAIMFLVLGALQVLPGFRNRNLARHRKLGRVAGVAGLIAALSGIWMTLAHDELATAPLYYARLLFGGLWAFYIVIAVARALRRNIPGHRAMMIRAYAIAANAGTLPFVYLPIYLIFGEMEPLLDDSVQILGWSLNALVAEWIIRRPQTRMKRNTAEAAQPAPMAMASDIRP